jgi:hypothetical protein
MGNKERNEEEKTFAQIFKDSSDSPLEKASSAEVLNLLID